MKLLSNIDLARLAGFFDGEGCIHISYYEKPKHTPTPIYRLLSIVSNTDKLILDEWHQKTGIGCRKNDQWQTDAWKAYDLLKAIYPYLNYKRPQAEIAFAFQETFNGRANKGGRGSKVSPDILRQRHRYYLALRQLKQRLL